MADKNTRYIVQPHDGAVIQEVVLQPWAVVDAMLERAAHQHADTGSRIPAYRRREILVRLAALLAAEAEPLALLIAREGGKPLADARVEVARAVDGVQLAAAELGHLAGVQIPMDLTKAGAGHTAFTKREPIGPVVAISAFNHPLNLIVHQVVPALAAGCPVMVKPALDTPLCCLRFVELAHQAGLPAPWCQVCLCEDTVAEQLAADPRVAFLTFIGSARVGWHLRSRLAPGARCALEHGGAAPVIVTGDADLAAAVPLLVKGGYYHAGQVCVSVQRVFVHNSLKQELTARLVEDIGVLVVGDPTVETTEVGPLIRPAEVDRVATWVDAAVAAGAVCPVGGSRIDDRFYRPTLLVDPAPASLVMTREVFGPVVSLVGYDAEQEAVDQANGLPFAFQAAVFGRDIQRCLGLADSLAATAVMINDHTAFRVDWMPFGGRRHSGLGVGGIPQTMRELSPEKLVVMREGG